MNKTKEISVDFRINSNRSNSLNVIGEEVEMMEEQRYLCVHPDNKIDWGQNFEAVYMKGQSRLLVLGILH